MVLQRRCSVCQRRPGPICQHCLGHMVPVDAMAGLPEADRAVALFCYDRLARAMVLAAKNRGRRDVLRCLGQLLAVAVRSLADDLESGPAVVTWVPASRAGRRRRGYDQGELLAAAVAAELGLDCVRLLSRGSGTGQTGRCLAARLEGPQFVAASPRRVRTSGASARAARTSTARTRTGPRTGRGHRALGTSVLLVDDV